MPIVLPCAHCGEKYQLSDTLAGKKVRCKACGRVFRVPVPSRPPSASIPVVPPSRREHSAPEKVRPLDPIDLYDLEDDEPQLDPEEAALRRAAGFEHLDVD